MGLGLRWWTHWLLVTLRHPSRGWKALRLVREIHRLTAPYDDVDEPMRVPRRLGGWRR